MQNRSPSTARPINPNPTEAAPLATRAVPFTFEGQTLTAYIFRDRECWIATDAGRALGYGANGKGLVDTMRSEWADELAEGEDFDVLKGADLAEFKRNLGDSEGTSLSFSARLVVLYESGLNVVCLKTEKPIGKRLRHFLKTEVLPKLRRSEPILPAGHLAPDPTLLAVMRDMIDRGHQSNVEMIRALREEMANSQKAMLMLLTQRSEPTLTTNGGAIGRARATAYIKEPITTLAWRLAGTFKNKPRKGWNGWLQVQVRDACGFFGSGRAWGSLPENDLPKAQAEITKWRMFLDAISCEPAVNAPVQQEMFDKDGNPVETPATKRGLKRVK